MTSECELDKKLLHYFRESYHWMYLAYVRQKMGQLSAYFTVSTPEEITKKELLHVGENNVDEA